MGIVSATFLACTSGMFLLALLAARLTEKATEVYYAAAVITMFAGFSRVMSMLLDPPISMAWYPVQDLICTAMCWGAYRSNREWWKAVLALCFLTQCGIHAWFWTAGDGSNHALRGYILANNIFYAAELAVLIVAGGGYVVGWVARRLVVFLVGPLAHAPIHRGRR